MEKFERTIRYIALFNIYYDLLTHTQKEVAEDYFLVDLSLSEIAVDRKISRSAVEDAIKKTCSKLDEFESKMHLLEKQEKLYKMIAKLKQKALNMSEIEELEALEKELDYGIWKLNRKAFQDL